MYPGSIHTTPVRVPSYFLHHKAQTTLRTILLVQSFRDNLTAESGTVFFHTQTLIIFVITFFRSPKCAIWNSYTVQSRSLYIYSIWS